MANVNRPHGASPVRSVISPWNGQVNLYWIPSTDNSAYYVGDIVELSTGADANGVPKITKAATSTSGDFLGEVVSVQFNPNNLNSLVIPATKTQDYYVYVADDPNALFVMQDDGVTAGNLGVAAVGKNSGFTVAAPSSSVVPTSASVLTSSTFATTDTLPIKIVGVYQVPGQTIGAYTQWLCKWNKQTLAGYGT